MRRVLLTLVALGSAAVLAACGGGAGGSANGGSLGAFHLDGAEFTVGSKEFTENVVLGQITIRALEAAGAKVTDKTGIQGTTNVRKALTSGQIDMYWDYTGTGWTTLLQHTPATAPRDAQQLFTAVATEDRTRNNVEWLPMAPLNDSYALGVSEANAAALHVQSISDYAGLARTQPAQATTCVASEFLTRDDGWPGVQRAYGFTVGGAQLQLVDEGLIYNELRTGAKCRFGEITSTDARTSANKLRVLTDDKHFFVLYNAALTIRGDVYRRYPQLAQIFAPISAKLTDDTVRALNEAVDIKGELPEQAADEFLKANGFVR